MIPSSRLYQIAVNLFHQGGIQAANMLLQLLLIPLVIDRAGIEANGSFLMSASIAAFAGTLINYAGNQTLPQEKQTQQSIAQVLLMRSLIFLGFLLIILIIAFFKLPIAPFLLGIIPLLFAEILNPFAYLLGENRIHLFNLYNLVARSLAILLVWLFVQHTDQVHWVNAWVGISLIPAYWILLIRQFKKAEKNQLQFSIRSIIHLLKLQSPLVAANLIVHLQQSFFLYVLGWMGQSIVFGIYAIADKLVWSARTLLIGLSNAIYPVAIAIYKEGQIEWKFFRKKINSILVAISFVAGILIFLLSPQLSSLLKVESGEEILTANLRWIAFVPLFMCLNLLNVTELLLRRDYKGQFQVHLKLFILTIFIGLSFLFFLHKPSSAHDGFNWLLPGYLLLMECLTLWMYEKHRHRIG